MNLHKLIDDDDPVLFDFNHLVQRFTLNAINIEAFTQKTHTASTLKILF